MDNATLSAYKQEFLDYVLTYKELSYVSFTDTPVADQKIIGVKLSTIAYLGSIEDDGSFKVRDDFVETLTTHGYSPEDSVIIDISAGYDETCTCDRTDCHNVYSSFSCKGTPAGLYLKDLVVNAVSSGTADTLINGIIEDWLLTPLLTNTHINAKTVFIVIPTLADESRYTSVITI